MIDAISSKYGVLPSEFIKTGNTQDIQIFILAERERERRERKAQGKSTADTYGTSELQEMLAQWQQNLG